MSQSGEDYDNNEDKGNHLGGMQFATDQNNMFSYQSRQSSQSDQSQHSDISKEEDDKIPAQKQQSTEKENSLQLKIQETTGNNQQFDQSKKMEEEKSKQDKQKLVTEQNHQNNDLPIETQTKEASIEQKQSNMNDDEQLIVQTKQSQIQQSLNIGSNKIQPPKQCQQTISQENIDKAQGFKKEDKIIQDPVGMKVVKEADEIQVKEEPKSLLSPPQIKKKEQEEDDQLERDMIALKKNFTQKDKKKNIHSKKQIEKQKLNKTMAHPLIKARHHEPDESDNEDVKVQEAAMISQMIHQKKKQNYQLLKKWDKRRQESLALHRNSIEGLQSQVDKRIKASIENLEVYNNFFKEKAKQEQKYVSHPIINTRYVLQNNSLSKNVYINCSVILNTLSDQNNARCRKINDFIHLIQNDILRNLMVEHLNQSQRQLLRVRQKISTLKSSLRKYNSETEEKANQLALFFNENIVTSNEKDFFAIQIEFLRKASQQTMVQKKLGEYCLEYYHLAVDQENKRSKVIREAVITFLKGIKQCYNIETDPAQIEQLSKAEEDKLIQQFYSLEEIFDERSLEVFRNRQNLKEVEELTIQHFTEYMKAFEFEPFDSRIILLKEFNIKHVTIPTKNSGPEIEQNCYLVITVDKHIHMFMNKQKTDPYAKPDVSLKLGSKNLEFKPSKAPQLLDIVLKDEKRHSMISYFWETKNDKIYRLKFPKQDTREQFIDFVTKRAVR